MAYTALYRKWRPQTFEDVRGQDPIIRTLKNQINSGRIGHAYLFSGTRGVGKTTVAKIFARAVNCEHPMDGSPCNECATCKEILSGASVNVVEIDAASNNGVDNIREIREEVKYRPTSGKYRVYIIDEVHMLSAGAFNALLKTLEEPPEYVIFILATTEVQKIPITVLSRCQRYDFKRLSLSELTKQIRDLLAAEKVEAEEGAISYIARTADGSSRDALSLLEQCISYYFGETLTYERVLDVLGAVDQTIFSKFLQAVLHYDVQAAIHLIDDMLSTGRDLSQFVLDFTWYLRNCMLIETENPGEEVLGISRENLEIMRREAADMDLNQVMRYIRILSELSNAMRYSPSKRVLLEVALIKMMQPATEKNYDSILDRLRFLEDQFAAGNVSSFDRRELPEDFGTGSAPKAEQKPPKEIEVTEADYNDYQTLLKDWPSILEAVGRSFRSMLKDTVISIDENGVFKILFRNEFFKTSCEKTGKLEEIQEVLKEKYGKTYKIRFDLLEEDEAPPRIVPGKRIPGIEMDIDE